ncbi:MAG: AmmeMemoRadiSam system protein B [Bacteroidota bacterium]
MQPIINFIFIMALIFNFNKGAAAQDNPNPIDRKPAAAGRFYPADPNELRTLLKHLFSKAKPRRSGHLAGIVCPHAGYVFSGEVAASSYSQVDPDMKYENVFVIASSHQVSFEGASVYNRGDYVTPLGKVKVNTLLANRLISSNPVFSFHPDADRTEHSVEVQIPFLQYRLKKDFLLVPIVIGAQSAATCRLIAEALKPWFNDRNLFVFSTDFSHYPSYTDAENADKATCDAIILGKPEKLTQFLDNYRDKEIPNLSTNLCGWTSVLTMLYLLSGEPGIKINPVHYMNSGDSGYGDKKQVVGYWSLALTRTGGAAVSKPLPSSSANPGTSTENGLTPFDFTREEKAALLKIARATIEKYTRERRLADIDTNLTPALKAHAGVFVTLKEHGELRGCIGRFSSEMPLYKLVGEMAIAASSEDSRFEPVSPKETAILEIEISVLSPLKKIDSPLDIIPGKHGIYIKKGYHSGTFLPQVAAENGWTREEFLGHCARDKAGIGWDGWKEADLFTYEACVFSEREISGRKD